MNLHDYDVVVISSSAGKDSQAMLTHLVELADEQGYDRSRLHVVHADLGRMEWNGTKELAKEQAEHYGLSFEVVRKPDTAKAPFDMIARAILRRCWPDAKRRWCTSDYKRDQIRKVFTRLGREISAREGRPARILSCLGIRAEESATRAKKVVFKALKATRTQAVSEWLPIHDWKECRVWNVIKRSGVRYHEVYDQGMPRLSCSFCVLAGRSSLVRAAQLRPELAQEIAEVEEQIGHTFKQGYTMRDVIEEAAATSEAEAIANAAGLVQLTAIAA